MAEYVQTTIVDDLDKTQQARHRDVLGINDMVVRLDLSDPHHQELIELLTPFLKAGQVVEGLSLIVEDVVRRIDPTDIRAWAKEAGIEIKSYGRIPAEIQKQYISSMMSTGLVELP